jgi:hypothetical protein
VEEQEDVEVPLTAGCGVSNKSFRYLGLKHLLRSLSIIVTSIFDKLVHHPLWGYAVQGTLYKAQEACTCVPGSGCITAPLQ